MKDVGRIRTNAVSRVIADAEADGWIQKQGPEFQVHVCRVRMAKSITMRSLHCWSSKLATSSTHRITVYVCDLIADRDQGPGSGVA